MASSPRHYSRPTSYDDPTRRSQPQPHPFPHNLYIQPEGNSSASYLAPPSIPTSNRRKRTSSLPSNATLLRVAEDRDRRRVSSQQDRPSPLALHSLHAEESPRMPSKLSKEARSQGSPSSYSSSENRSSSSPWYTRWFFGSSSSSSSSNHSSPNTSASSPRSQPQSSPQPPQNRRRSMSFNRKSKHGGHFKDDNAPPLPTNNPYWQEKETTQLRRGSVNMAELAGSAGDDYAF